MSPTKLLKSARSSPAGLRFSGLCRLAEALGFIFQRQKGSHWIYAHPGKKGIMNFQNDRGMAKAYQVKQLLEFVDRYSLTLEKEND